MPSNTRDELKTLLTGKPPTAAQVTGYLTRESVAAILGSVALYLFLAANTDQAGKDYAAAHGLTPPVVSRRRRIGEWLAKVGWQHYSETVGQAASRLTQPPVDSDKARDKVLAKAAGDGVDVSTLTGAALAKVLTTAAEDVRTNAKAIREQAKADREAAKAKADGEAEGATPATIADLITNGSKVFAPVIKAVNDGSISDADLKSLLRWSAWRAEAVRLGIDRGLVTPSGGKPAAGQSHPAPTGDTRKATPAKRTPRKVTPRKATAKVAI